MKAACLLTDSMYSLAVSANGGIGAGSEALCLGSNAAGKSMGGDKTTGAGLMGRVGSRWYPLELDLELPELASIPELARKLTLEQVWKLALEYEQTPVAGRGLAIPAGSFCLRCPNIRPKSWSSSGLCRILGRLESYRRL